MKKILNILFLLPLLVFLSSCEETGTGEVESAIEIVKADTFFDALGGSGVIEVSAPGTVTAESSQTWCVPTVSGNRINFTVDSHEKLASRTARISVKWGNDTEYVSVTQQGAILNVPIDPILFEKAASTYEIPFVATVPFEIIIPDGNTWLTAVPDYDRNVIVVSATKNETWTVLSSTITVRRIEGPDVVIDVTQEEIEYDDLVGDWKVTATRQDATAWENLVFGFTANPAPENDSDDRTFTVTGIDAENHPKFSYRNKSLYIAGQTLTSGLLGTSIYVMNAAAVRHTNPAVSISGEVTVSGTDLTCTFRDNGSWAGNTAIGFCVASLFGVNQNRWYQDVTITKEITTTP